MTINSRPTRLSLVFFFLIASAAAENLNIKPGLWEVTSKTDAKGAPPISAAQREEMEKQLAQLSPENRAKAEAAMKAAQARQGQPVVRKSCITKEDLSKPLAFDGGRGDGSCTRTILKSTSSVQEVRLDCTNNAHKSGGTLRIVATNPEAWSGTLDGSASDTGGAMTLKSTVSGKWLGADCGSIKPSAQK
jgi:hypothetical protein